MGVAVPSSTLCRRPESFPARRLGRAHRRRFSALGGGTPGPAPRLAGGVAGVAGASGGLAQSGERISRYLAARAAPRA